jgi:hypothetical protein
MGYAKMGDLYTMIRKVCGLAESEQSEEYTTILKGCSLAWVNYSWEFSGSHRRGPVTLEGDRQCRCLQKHVLPIAAWSKEISVHDSEPASQFALLSWSKPPL